MSPLYKLKLLFFTLPVGPFDKKRLTTGGDKKMID